MPRDTRNIGLAFLLSILLVAGVAMAGNLLFSPTEIAAACQQHYTVACLI